MYLKSLEAAGFKSFAEKIKLDFGPGISAIIAPNGSGKSNVSDAIKWVLGEQSARSLRSSQMTDVIFNGTENRRPASGMAEVTLTFDNSDGVLPIGFTEVIITRKIYRSGEGEYYINKSPCRLKDIRELFAGTGIGADGYSIVEQREVEFVIESRPDERRELIEEAAGISRYRFRKEESLRKLERVRQDLARINDMLSLHEEQVKSLESAARKARQHQKLQEELRRAELAFIIKQVDEHRAKISEHQEKLNPLIEKREKYVADYDGMLAEASKIREELANIDKEIISRQEEISKTSSRMDLADTRISQAEELIRGCQERIRMREEENSRCAEEIKKIESSKEEIVLQLSALESAASSVKTRYDEAKRIYQEASSQLDEIKKEEDEILKKIISAMPVLSEKNNVRVRCESDISHIESLIAANEEEVLKSENALNEARGVLEDKKKSREGYEASILSLDENFSRLEKELAALVSRRDALRARLEAKSREVSVIEGELSAVKNFEESDPVLHAINLVKSSPLASGDKIRGPVGELFSISKKDDGAADENAANLMLQALGEKALYMVADTIETAESAVSFLKENNLCALTFVVESGIRAIMSGGNDSNFDGLVVPPSVYFKSDSDKAVVSFLLSDINKIAPAGAMYFKNGVLVRGGAGLPVTQGSVGARRNTLKERLEIERGQIEALASELQGLSSEIERLSVTEENLSAELRTKKPAKEWLDKEIAELEKLVREREDYLNNTLSGEMGLNKSRLEELRSILSQTLEEIERLRHEEEVLKKKLEEARARSNEILPRVEELKKNFQGVEAELFTVEPKIDSLKSKIKSLDEQRALLENTIAQNLKEIESWRVEITEHHEKVKSQEFAALQEARELKERLTSELAAVFASKEEVSKRLSDVEESLRNLEHSREELNEEIHKIEMDVRAFSVGLDSLLARLKDDYETDEQSARACVSDSLLDAEEMAKLRKRIEALGSVNLAAPEEYEALNRKYQFILSQRDDLEKAKSDLEEIISKINKTTKEQLTDTFNKVRENFQQVFAKLFEGGQGDLVLTNPDNILESGVDIIARPPGKTTKCLSLSGGEKALTAIALLFSFFLVRPAPFCLLDEVDAPLDEANVERFLNLLETFADKTQFLLITHNKRTMLRAGVIYGITMEEFGVSKALSIRMEDATAASLPA